MTSRRFTFLNMYLKIIEKEGKLVDFIINLVIIIAILHL